MELYNLFDSLHRHYATAQKIKEPPREEKLAIETLADFVKDIKVSISAVDCVRIIDNAGHGRMLRSAYRLLLNRGNDSKLRVCWFIGPRNSGKSQFIRRLGEIFASDEVDWRGKYLVVSKTNQRKVQTQVVTCEEFHKSIAFSKENLCNTKKLFEGAGAPVQGNLFQQIQPKYEKACFALASNMFPTHENTGYSHREFEQDVMEPMKARIDITYLTEKHSGSVEFPYSVAELAHALYFLCRYPCVCADEDLKELDDTEVTDDKKDDLNWLAELAEEQRKQFMSLIETIAYKKPEEDERPFADSTSDNN